MKPTKETNNTSTTMLHKKLQKKSPHQQKHYRKE